MKPLNWVELTRQQIKARHGFGWSILREFKYCYFKGYSNFPT